MTGSVNNAQTVWRAACDHLRKVLHPDVFSRWIEVIEPGTLEDRTLSLMVGNNFYQTWPSRRFPVNPIPLRLRSGAAPRHFPRKWNR
jgi:hypothetical protein